MSTVLRSGVLVVLTAIGGAACATTRAEVALERPALDVPPPPPRMIVPLPPPPQSPRPDPVPALGEAGTSPAAKPRPPRESKDAPPKPEPKPEEKPAETPPPASPPSPVPPLRISDQVDPNQLAAQIRGSIDRTLGTLNGIDYGKLQEARRKQYEEAKLFATQADQALKEKNLVVAKEFADKAERLTKELTSR
jgi:hypothetical protein